MPLNSRGDSKPSGDESTERFRHVGILAFGAFAIVVMTLSSQSMSSLRAALPPLSLAMNWLAMLPVPVDLDHVAFFALLGFSARLLAPRAAGWRILVLLFALALLTEFLQFWSEGRTPKLQDARDDMVGAMLGFALAGSMAWAGGHVRWWLVASRVLALAGIAALPLQQLHVLAVGGHRVLPTDLLLAAAVGCRVMPWLARQAPISIGTAHAWLLAYVLAMAMAWPFGTWAMLASFGKWLGIVHLALIAVLFGDLAREPQYRLRIAQVWVWTATVTAALSLLAIVAFYFAPGTPWLQSLYSHYGSLPPGPYPRVLSTFANANMYCSYLIVALCLALALRASSDLPRWATPAILCLLVLAALATISPGLGGVALVLGLWIACQPQSWHARRSGVAVAVGAWIAVLFLASALVNLGEPFQEPSVRWQIWRQAWDIWLAHPWRGVGTGQDVVGVAFTAPSGDAQWLTDAHNIWLNVAGQAGIAAVVSLAGLSLSLVLGMMRRNTAFPDPFGTAVLLAMVAAFLYAGLTSSLEDARHVWIVIGLAMAMTQGTRQDVFRYSASRIGTLPAAHPRST